jgi:hypothetical protein
MTTRPSLPYELVSPLSRTPLRTVSARRRSLMLSLDREARWARCLRWLLYWWGPDPYLVATDSNGAHYRRVQGHAALTDSSVGSWGCAACGFSDEAGEVEPTSVQCVSSLYGRRGRNDVTTFVVPNAEPL